MAEDGHYENLELEQIDNATYDTLQTKTKEEKDLLIMLRADTRRNRQVGACLGLFCAILAILSVAVPLYLYQSTLNTVERQLLNTVERQQLLNIFEQLQNRHSNLSEQKDHLQSRCDKLVTSQARHDILTEERDQLQTRINSLTEERDDLKKRLCESPGWQTIDRTWYYISTEKKNWTESRQWCRDRQSDLITIKTAEKQDFVKRVDKRVWLGLTDREVEGSFQWVDGTPLTTPTYWIPGEPNNYLRNDTEEQQHCIEFYDGSSPSWSSDRGWNDGWCSTHKYWICERTLC